MSLKDLYDSIDLDTIEGFINEQQEEHVGLDFKEVNDSTMNKADRKNFAKALSGFANSSGGILVWGVQACKQNGDEHDYACGLPGIDDAPLFVQKLNEHTGSSVMPIVEGVENAVIPTGKGSHGFAKTFIPESDLCPHQAKAGITQYFKRSGDSFYKMEHYDIADMFGKRRRPALDVSYEISLWSKDKLRVRIWLENNGRGTAKSPYIALVKDFHTAELQSATGLPLLPGVRVGGWKAYGSQEGVVIHPGAKIFITQYGVPITPVAPQSPYEITFHCEVAAEGVPVREVELVVPVGEYVDSFDA